MTRVPMDCQVPTADAATSIENEHWVLTFPVFAPRTTRKTCTEGNYGIYLVTRGEYLGLLLVLSCSILLLPPRRNNQTNIRRC